MLPNMVLVRATGGKKIEPSPREGSSDDVNFLMLSLESASRNEQRLLRSQCLKRDGYKCKLTQLFDISSVKSLPQIHEKMKMQQVGTKRARAGATELAHILPFSLAQFDDEKLGEVSHPPHLSIENSLTWIAGGK
jgi:hypothetical protein